MNKKKLNLPDKIEHLKKGFKQVIKLEKNFSQSTIEDVALMLASKIFDLNQKFKYRRECLLFEVDRGYDDSLFRVLNSIERYNFDPKNHICDESFEFYNVALRSATLDFNISDLKTFGSEKYEFRQWEILHQQIRSFLKACSINLFPVRTLFFIYIEDNKIKIQNLTETVKTHFQFENFFVTYYPENTKRELKEQLFFKNAGIGPDFVMYNTNLDFLHEENKKYAERCKNTEFLGNTRFSPEALNFIASCAKSVFVDKQIPQELDIKPQGF